MNLFPIAASSGELTPERLEGMSEVQSSWMDDYIEAILVQKKEPGNLENQKRMISLTKTAETWQPKLTEYMKDETFSII